MECSEDDEKEEEKEEDEHLWQVLLGKLSSGASARTSLVLRRDATRLKTPCEVYRT